ncbi:hydrogenase formation protein HypD [Helicobacter saguini]|uniref:Hydrogenase formation protein HypD n=1 Tax=Helicobacter saguini TaxID=1548018 RepID=A0A347VN97_9HELI|nr:hydrogenase formation protein HypD [Helicobacter saguini]MWV61849.1 hydrogenase formation protein HypD [Helicobacter saguini]MWV67476.1 hydrogenase formation protein HypD [Helicobacter saguini]MWV69827.1 hydrogenase formation protein HypD [Helicobacter saguini]MWV72955.1 hydrogenase formation protein HypD [Helicobacter saguini]TLD95662.1 hydrogenase formation protein HypD [Helicobacter saguini]
MGNINDFINPYRDKNSIQALSKKINALANELKEPIFMMEVCGGHTHTLMKFGLKGLIDSKNLHFIHGPGCPVCIMPKGRISEAYELSMMSDTILVTLGDMIKVPGQKGSLADARARGADVRFIYSPFDCLAIARENPHKKIVYFAIGFETTTPMSAALLQRAIDSNITNLFLHINHVLVPPPVRAILDDKRAKVNALIAPSHVSVISGSKIYEPLARDYQIPIVVSGFEPVDMLESILKIITQRLENRACVENQYSRVVNFDGNLKAQEMVAKYFEIAPSFVWRGLGEIKHSSLRLRDEFSGFDAEKVFKIPKIESKESKNCLCGEILKGLAEPKDCKVFGKACTPSKPMGSCMVSSEGACAAYYKYGMIV